MAQKNRIENVAIVGATGRIGEHFVGELLKTGQHAITALTRSESKGTVPEGVKTIQVDYDDEPSLVAALSGQDFFIITIGHGAPVDTHSKLTKAAGMAGVPFVMPNAYGYDICNESLARDEDHVKQSRKHCEETNEAGSAYIAMICGFWYEHCLSNGEPYFGIDIKTRKVTLFDEGNVRISISTWLQCGRALARLLSLPVAGASPSVSTWENKPFYISSFQISQRDMLDSLNRVLHTTDEDWEISQEPIEQRLSDAIASKKKGDVTGAIKAMLSRIFLPVGDGNFESRGLANDLLVLPKEDLDEATRRAVDMVNMR